MWGGSARRGIPDPQSKQNTKPTPPKSQRSARSDGRFRGDSQSPGIGPRATPDTTTAHTRDPFAPHLFVRAWRQRSPHHGHPQRVPSRSLRPLTSRLISVQPVLGAELQSVQQLCGAPAAFFLCARAGGVAWRGVACFGPLNPLGPSGNTHVLATPPPAPPAPLPPPHTPSGTAQPHTRASARPERGAQENAAPRPEVKAEAAIRGKVRRHTKWILLAVS